MRRNLNFAEDLDFELDVDKQTCKNFKDNRRTEECKRLLKRAINCLPGRDKRIMKLYIYEGSTLTEIAKEYRLSRQRIHQIIKRSVRRIKRYTKGKRKK